MPATYAGRPELDYATWSWTAETAAHTLRVIFGGVFDRFPPPQGEAASRSRGRDAAYLLWRLDKRAQAFTQGAAIKPSEVFRRNIAITTAGTFSDEPLDCALEALGEDSIMFSVDPRFEEMKEASAWWTPPRSPMRCARRFRREMQGVS